MIYLFIILLPLAAASGWIAGFRHHKVSAKFFDNGTNVTIPNEYFIGLNYLINEQPDKAVDVFIKMLEVNSDTVETHLALGNLFRKRGEVDRAIRIHQNLIARPQLEKYQRIQSLSELAQDYLRAGVLDRAERLFLELIEMGEETTLSYTYLLNIYQQQKEWNQAITVAKKLQPEVPSMHVILAFYYCELAELARAQGQNKQAHEYVKEAIFWDKNCARASIITGKLAAEVGDFNQAIRAYKKIKEQNPDLISEIVTPLADCYSKLNLEADLIQYLQDCLIEYPRVSLVLALSDYVRKWHGDAAAIDFLTEKIQHCLSLRGVGRLVDLYVNNAEATTKDKFMLLHQFIGKLLENKPIYRCLHCGFAGKQLYWQCPSCKRWGAVKTIHGLEGD